MSGVGLVADELESWATTIDALSFSEGCDVLSDLHGVSVLVRSLLVDVVGSLHCSDGSLHDHLCLQLGLTRTEAKELVLVASALPSLPCLASAFRSGALDWHRLVLVVQLASSPQDDVHFAHAARDYSLHQLRVMLARKKAGDVTRIQRAQAERSVRFYHYDKDQCTKLVASFPLDIGLALEKQVQQRADSLGIDTECGTYLSPDQAMADGLCALVFGQRGPRAELLVDLEPSALVGEGKADLQGHTISLQTLQRLACDGSLRPSFLDDRGLPVSLGRRSRLFPPWLSRQIAHRDRGCRFPGCASTRWLHDHHLLEWDADHGPTDYDNGIQLCGTHHRYVHEGGWKIRGNPEHALAFIRADGRVFDGHASAISSRLSDRVLSLATKAVERVRAEHQAQQALRDEAFEERLITRELEHQAQQAERQQRRQWQAEHQGVASAAWGDPP